jgi:hypothetical protein
MNIENQKFEEWRNEQIASMVRMGYLDAAKSFRDLGSVQWAGWQAGWQASRAAIEVELPEEGSMRGDGHFFEIGVEACKEAIESLGLKVKS